MKDFAELFDRALEKKDYARAAEIDAARLIEAWSKSGHLAMVAEQSGIEPEAITLIRGALMSISNMLATGEYQSTVGAYEA